MNTPVRLFFIGFTNAYEAKIGFNRLQEFLNLPETKEDDRYQKSSNTPQGSVTLESVSVSYNIRKFFNRKKLFEGKNINESLILRDLDVVFAAKHFVGIIGKVGCGKTSLLRALLNQNIIEKGKISLNGSIAYISQESFLMNTSVRENILFGKEYEEKKYQKILEHCQLLDDLKSFPSFDITEIGERGLNLSGGQKQRINIARSVYADADIYLIDDSLSALDAYVGQKIFKEVFMGLLKQKTKIMVTHALQYIKDLDKIVFIKEGRIHCQGKWLELFEQNAEFTNFVQITQKKQKRKDSMNLSSKMSHSLQSDFQRVSKIGL